jgi:hypothetical protein
MMSMVEALRTGSPLAVPRFWTGFLVLAAARALGRKIFAVDWRSLDGAIGRILVVATHPHDATGEASAVAAEELENGDYVALCAVSQA